MRVAVAGFGAEGQASLRYWLQQGAEVAIADEHVPTGGFPENILTITGPGAFERLNGFDLVVRTAGLNPGKIKTDGIIWSATNEFFEKCPAKIIGVTGTKGKGTTASYIASVLRAAGKTVHLVGNIGVPALNVLSKIRTNDIVVYELSSFQLWDIKKSPHTAVVLMIEPDHLNVHLNMYDYVKAKSHIRLYQNAVDTCWYHPHNALSKQVAESASDGRIAAFNDARFAGSVYISNGSFWRNEQELCSIDAMVLPGAHNLDNACAALSAALEYTDDYSLVEAGLRSFTGLPHRLQYVRSVAGVRYYDDSIATTPGSAVAALRAFEQPKVILLGGRAKGGTFESVIAEAVSCKAKIIAFGESASDIAALASAHNVPCHQMLKRADMFAIVQAAAAIAEPESVVIMSPAAASFDMYENYEQRGRAFVDAVKRLAEVSNKR